MGGGVATLEALRERIRVLEGGARIRRARVPSGLPMIDGLIRGLPRPGVIEVSGPAGSGSTRLVVALAVASRGRIAWVDVDRTLYPPAIVDMGMDPRHLLMIRPAADGGRPEDWAVEQLLRSGCFPLVVVSGIRAIPRAAGQRWSLAAEHGRCTGVVLTGSPQRDLPADVRLQVAGGEVAVARDRDGEAGKVQGLPPLPQEVDPWE